MSFLRPVFAAALGWCTAGVVVSQETPAPIATAIEVRSLTIAQAQQGLPVRLRGIVVFIEPASVFVQDATSTAFFRPNQLGILRPGDEIEVQGTTRMGLFLPGIGSADFRILGHRPLPPGIPATFDDIAAARHHYRRVEVSGIVRALAAVDEGRSLLRLAQGSRLLEVRIDAPPDRERALVDSRVRIHGLAAGFINDRRQLVQPYVRVIDWSDVAIVDAAPAAPPLVSAAELLAFRVAGRKERRIRIQGTVTASFPGGRTYLRRGEEAVEVQVEADALPTPGDRVEVAGFPEMGRFSASVVDAVVLRREPGPAPAPIDAGSPDKLGGPHDAQLVTVTARVTDAFRSEDGLVLVLQGPGRTIRARVPDRTGLPEIGSTLRVTGVCLVESNQPAASGFSTRPGTVSLRVRSTEDWEVIRSAPWWTVRRLVTVLAGLAGLTLIAGLWIAALRRQVERQTAALRRRIETEAALEERHRIAREFHDSLEQELAGVSLRLDALATRPSDDKGRALIGATRNLVSRIQTETRDLVSDLRDQAERAGDLRAALAAVAGRQALETGVDIRLEAGSELPPLEPATVHDLRMMARELIHNARKHGRATSVVVSVGVGAGRLTMTVEDNGCGFDPTAVARERRGHFGCAGICERGRKIRADVSWRSTLQKGTTVEVSLPVPVSRPPAAVVSAASAAMGRPVLPVPPG
jgi:signal transduction histidine kinase